MDLLFKKCEKAWEENFFFGTKILIKSREINDAVVHIFGQNFGTGFMN